MSAGKYQIIETIMSYTSQYSFAELNKFSVQELYNILAIFNQEEVTEGCHSVMPYTYNKSAYAFK